MGGFFSRSSSRRRYPDPYQGGRHYKKKGLFGMLSGFGGSFGSGSRSGRNRYGGAYNGYQGQGGYQTNLAGEQMTCPKCGASVPAGSKFCLSCGEKIEANAAFCPNCGKPLPPGARFCMECGSPVRK